MQKFKEIVDSRKTYQFKLNKTSFQLNMVYGLYQLMNYTKDSLQNLKNDF